MAAKDRSGRDGGWGSGGGSAGPEGEQAEGGTGGRGSVPKAACPPGCQVDVRVGPRWREGTVVRDGERGRRRAAFAVRVPVSDADV